MNSSQGSEEGKDMKTKSHNVTTDQSEKRGSEKTPCRNPRFTQLIRLASALLVLNIPSCTASGIPYCPVNQTAELGKVGTIDCKLPDNFYAVYLYLDPPDEHPLVRYERHSQKKWGSGFLNNTFDIAENGSFVILKVGVEHERAYVVIVLTDSHTFERNNVSLKVVVYPGKGSLKTECDNCRQNYYHVHDGSNTLTCIFEISRPPVQLEWIERSINGDSHVKYQTNNTVDNGDGTYNSSTTVRLTKNGYKQIANFVCRAIWDLGKWRGETEMLIDFSRSEWFSDLKFNTLESKVNSKIEIHCEGSGQDSIIWKKVLRPHEPETIGFSTGDATEVTTKLPGIEISDDGSLIFSSLQIDHGGLYACLYSDGKQDEINMTNVVVYEPPSTLYIQIIGCKINRKEPCKFDEEDTDRISFAVHGAPRNFSARWNFQSSKCISFPSHEINITGRGETVGVAVSKTFEVCVDVLCEEELLITCNVYDPVLNITSASVAALIIPKSCRTERNTFLRIFLIILAAIVIVIFLIICWRLKTTVIPETTRAAIE